MQCGSFRGCDLGELRVRAQRDFMGYPEVESAIEGIRQQIDDYFVKPCDVDLLVQRIHERLEAQNSVQE